MSINLKKFILDCRSQTLLYDSSISRKYNRNAIGNWVREGSYYLAYVFCRIGLHGPHILFAHFSFDLIALWFAWQAEPLYALGYWLVAHVLDNCDGIVARYWDEADNKWGEFDIFLHLIANMAFWMILSVWAMPYWTIVVLLAFRVIQESFRRQKTNETRYGERSRLWKWIALPTNVNIIYLSYVPFALIGRLDWYISLYALYFAIAATGQSIVYVRQTVK